MVIKRVPIIVSSLSLIFLSAISCADLIKPTCKMQQVANIKSVADVKKQKLQGSCLKKTFKVAGKTLQDVKPKNEYFSTTLKLIPLSVFYTFLSVCSGAEEDPSLGLLSLVFGGAGLLVIGCVSAPILAVVQVSKKFKQSRNADSLKHKQAEIEAL